MTFIETNNENILAYERQTDSQKITCLFNLSEENQTFDNHHLKPLETKFIEEQ